MLKMHCAVATLVCLLLFVDYCHPYCYYIENEPDSNVCKTKDGTTLQDGESIKYQEKCEQCTCLSNILSCCGYGIHGGVFSVPGCQVVADTDGCSVKVVDKNDASKPCRYAPF